MNKTLYAYYIENDKISKTHSDFCKKFIEKLSKSDTIKARCYEINQETRESDILLKTISTTKTLAFGIIARIKPTKDMPSMPDDYLNRKSLEVSELEGLGVSSEKMSCRDIDYFILDQEHVVTTISSTRISRFKAFVNHFLELERGDTLYSFASVIETPKEIKLEDLTQITFSGKPGAINLQGVKETVGAKIISMAKEKLTSLVDDSSIQFLIDKNILTANLVIKFNTRNKKLNNDESIKRAMSAVITNLATEDGVQFATRKKQKINAGMLKKIKVVEIDAASNGQPNEESLRQEMKEFLRELRGTEI